MPINYQNSKIYVIRSHQTEKIYIGSTVNELRIRFQQHKSHYKTKIRNCSSFEIIKYDDCYIELYEKYPCNDKDELRKREGEIIRSLDCVNKYIAGRTANEYHKQNRDKILEKQKEYEKKNKEKIKQRKKKYYEKNPNKLLERKKYYKDYYEKIKNKRYICVCGSNIRKLDKSAHEKTKKHINFINN